MWCRGAAAGETTWEKRGLRRCLACNVRKGGRTPHEAHIETGRDPGPPKRNPLLLQKLNNPKYESWRTWLDSVLLGRGGEGVAESRSGGSTSRGGCAITSPGLRSAGIVFGLNSIHNSLCYNELSAFWQGRDAIGLSEAALTGQKSSAGGPDRAILPKSCFFGPIVLQ